MRWLRLSAVALGICCSGCDGKLLPDFNGGVLNPEFRFLRAADVMNGVKCAMTAFMLEREFELLKQRETYPDYFRAIEGRPSKGIEFRKYALNASVAEPECGPGEHWAKPAPGNACAPRSAGCCVPNKCADGAIGVSFWNYKEVGGPADRKQKGCVPVPDYSRFALDANQSATITFTLSANNSGFINYSRIDATKLDGLFDNWIVAGGGPKNQPFPQLLPSLKGTNSFEMAVLMPQSLHVSSAAVIPPIRKLLREGLSIDRSQVTKLASYTAADPSVKLALEKNEMAMRFAPTGPAAALNLLQASKEVVEQRGPALADPTKAVPQVLNKLEAEVDRALQVPDDQKAALVQQRVTPKLTDLHLLLKLNKQTELLDEKATKGANEQVLEEQLVTLRGIAQQITDDRVRGSVQATIKKIPQYSLKPVTVPAAPAAIAEETFTPQALATLKAPTDRTSAGRRPKEAPAGRDIDADPKAREDFKHRCIEDRFGYRLNDHAHIDYLALKSMLHNVVSQQNDRLHTNGPPLTLETLTLSTSFQMVLEVQAGTNHIFRIVPLLSAPNTQFKTDHSHTLKIVMRGVKKKGDPDYARKLMASCKARLQTNLANVNEIRKCETLEGLLLEAITEGVESGPGG